MSTKLHTLISGVGYGNESNLMHQRIYDEIVKEVLGGAEQAVKTVQQKWGVNEEGWPYAAIDEALDAIRALATNPEAKEAR